MLILFVLVLCRFGASSGSIVFGACQCFGRSESPNLHSCELIHLLPMNHQPQFGAVVSVQLSCTLKGRLIVVLLYHTIEKCLLSIVGSWGHFPWNDSSASLFCASHVYMGRGIHEPKQLNKLIVLRYVLVSKIGNA